MLHDTQRVVSQKEIAIDMLCGYGGATLGMEDADVAVADAINHDPLAISLHLANHPGTVHHVQDAYNVSPQWVVRGRPLGMLWMSPDCTHHSNAKGGPPVRNARIRELARVLVDRWLPELKPSRNMPRVIALENVREFLDWGPLDRDGKIIEERKGESFRRFVRDLTRFGYKVEWRILRACDYGAPTSRERFFLIARRDKRPIVWPEPTHGAPDSPGVKAGYRKPWKTAADCIDWSLPCPSIFASKKEIRQEYGIAAQRPLKKKTLQRIARGVKKYVLETDKPFLLSMSQEGQTCGRTEAVAAFLTKYYSTGGQWGSLHDPAPTVLCVEKLTLAMAHMVKLRGTNTGDRADRPVHTVSAQGTHHALALTHVAHSSLLPFLTKTELQRGRLAAAFLTQFNSCSGPQPLDEPMPTVTTMNKLGLVTVIIDGETWAIIDIRMRMLTPRELARAQGFPDTYVLDTVQGRYVSKRDQVRYIGNAVPPQLAKALVMANFTPRTITGPAVDMPLFQALSRHYLKNHVMACESEPGPEQYLCA